MGQAFGPVPLTCRRSRRVYSYIVAASLAALSYVPARAQSVPGAFQGSITKYTGTVDRAVSVNSETITIGSPTASINWSPYDKQSGTSPIDFLPAGNTATFTSAQGITDYTVLNKILPNDPDRPIALNGTVISTLQGTSAIGGHVWFYTAGGILIGSTAVFDVGGLLLTTIDPDIWSASDTGFNAILDCDAAGGCRTDPVFPDSKIEVLPGARIDALQQNSYVAMVAPRIEQGGAVRVNGSAAYVAAEKVAMTFDQGLFDIQVDLGTSDANGVVHTGETSGPANGTSGDHHVIYLVAVPKNEALTMLLDGGRIGFEDAVNASTDNGQIILSAGYGVSGMSFDSADGGGTAAPASGITIAGGDFTSSVTGQATGSIDVSGGGGTLNFANDVYLQALQSLTLVALSGEAVTVGGDAQIRSGEDIDIRTEEGGSLTVSGALEAIAEGSINLSDDGGSIAADLLDLSAGDIVSTAPVDASTIIFAATNDITTDDLHATEYLSLTAGGNLDTGNLVSGGDMTLQANGDVLAGDLTGDSVAVDAAGNFTIADVEAQDGTFTAGGLASFQGVVAAEMITVTSSDIDIEQGTSLGVFGLTKLLTLNATSDGSPIVIGGVTDIAAGQYQLFEDGTVEADAIVFNAIGEGSAGDPDILVGDFEISGTAAQGGGVGSFTMNTDGQVRLDGDLRLANAATGDTLTINAGHAIEVNTDSGSIALTDSSGQLAGVLNLNADNIWITDSALLSQLEINPDFPGRDNALATNSGVTSADGFVRAGAITATLNQTLLVQNAGTEENPTGIAVGDGGLTIVNDGQGSATVIVFGSQTNSDGTVIDGNDFVGEVTLIGAGGFTSNSSVNGCAVGVPCIAPPDLPPEAILGPVELMISTLDVDPITLFDITLSGENALLDDPVTSGSDPVPFDAMTSGNDPRPTESRCPKPRSGTRRCK
jgi:filamentous hemagglutinin family protein